MKLRKYFQLSVLVATAFVMSVSSERAGIRCLADQVTDSGPETEDLPTKFARIVVTDDQGRYLLPDLRQANYQIFARGYGLVDSQRQPAAPGHRLDIKARVAPDAKSAAQVYPVAW